MMAPDAIMDRPAATALMRYQVLADEFDEVLMAASDVDQRFLGALAQHVAPEHPLLASMLFQILGLSVLLARKLVRARRLRKLDPTRDTKSLQLYYHIIWLAREGLVILDQYVQSHARLAPELQVLAAKLRGSFYHIFVLFHNQPSINQLALPGFQPRIGSLAASASASAAAAAAAASTSGAAGRASSRSSGHGHDRNSILSSPDPFDGGPVRQPLPPGLAPISIPKPAASFLLPAIDYIPMASQHFAEAALLADRLLTGSHPLRVSVKVEYAAYLYDCLHDGEASRKLAAQSLREVYTDPSAMDDDMFEETARLVVILDRMKKRGAAESRTPSGQGSTGSGSTPRARPGTGFAPDLPRTPTMGTAF